MNMKSSPTNYFPNLVSRQFTKALCAAVSKVRSFDPLDNFMIFSDPRGGSTWLSEVVSLVPNTVVLWEPLNQRWVRHFDALDFAKRQYIPEDAVWPEAEEAFRELLRGKYLTNGLCKVSPPLGFISAARMVVKFCRGNALLPWLTRAFSFNYAPVYLVRHPFAVVASQLQHGSWDYPFTGFEIPDGPYNDIYQKHSSYLASIETKEEALTAFWCLTNAVPMQNRRDNVDWITVYYEHLLSNPEKELNKIFQRWGMALPDAALARIRTPSATTKEATFTEGVEAQLEKWQSALSADQQAKMFDVLSYFGLKRYGMEVYPDVTP